jgi:protein ImuB
VQAVKGARRLAEVNEAASAAGLWAGQKLADAMALEPGLQTDDFDPEADARALKRLSDACARFSPAVAVDVPDGLFLDVTGAAHLWGGEAGMLAAVEATLARWGVPARLGLADTAGAAWALARFGAGREIAAPGAQAERLAGLPVEALRAGEGASASLRRLGLRTVGEAAGLPRAQLAKRFDPELLLRLDQAHGQAEEALAFRRPPSPWIHRLRLAEPISTGEDFARVVGDLAAGLCERLAAEGRGGRRFEAAFSPR